MIRNNKPLLFAALGFAGGIAGSLLAELVPHKAQTYWEVLATVAALSALAGGAIALALFVASELYHRRRNFFSRQALGYLVAGLMGGAIAGAVAQGIYGLKFLSGEIKHYVVRPLCWGLMGSILGWSLATTIPNLRALRAAVAGGIGGTVGGGVFLLALTALPDTVGRLAGFGALGAALGLAIVVVDSLFREATLEIVWAPKEVTTIGLGRVPVRIGGGDDHIHVHGLPPNTASIVIEQGKIQYIDTATGRRTDLRNGSKVKIGRIEVIVHATT